MTEPQVALSQVVSQGADTKCQKLAAQEIKTAYANWTKAVGDRTGKKKLPRRTRTRLKTSWGR